MPFASLAQRMDMPAVNKLKLLFRKPEQLILQAMRTSYILSENPFQHMLISYNKSRSGNKLRQ